MTENKKLACPICKAPSAEAYRPFCSKRCADIDLGRWFSGGYVVERGGDDADEDGFPAPPSSPRESDQDAEK